MNEQSIDEIFKKLNSKEQGFDQVLQALNKKENFSELLDKFRNKFTISAGILYEYNKFIEEMNVDPFFITLEEFKSNLKNLLEMKGNELNSKLINEFVRYKEDYLEKKKSLKLTAYYNGR